MACARIFIKTDSTEKKFVIKQENILFLRCVRASFSPEILHDGAVKGLIWFCGLYSFKGETESSPKSGIPSITKSILRLALLTTVSPELRFGVLFIRVPLCLEMYTLFGSESRAAHGYENSVNSRVMLWSCSF